MSSLPTVCILAGGLGKRLGEQVADTPKPLLEVAGQPFLLHQLQLLAAYGARDVVLCVGYLGEKIASRIGREQFGIRIEYSHDAPGLDGTLGAIRRALPLLPREFLILYGDTYLRIDYRDVAAAWSQSGRLGLMTVLRNEDRWDTSNVVFRERRVLAYDRSHPRPGMHWIDYGLGGLDRRALALVDADERDLAILYKCLAESNELFGYEATERFYEIGTPDALTEADAFLRHAAVAPPNGDS